MSYDNPTVISYDVAYSGAGTTTRAITGPSGKTGRVVSICNSVTTTLSGAVTGEVGITGTLAKFGVLVTATTTAGGIADEGGLVALDVTADTNVLLTVLGPATSGAGTITFAVAWN